jgi:hypothetical protein
LTSNLSAYLPLTGGTLTGGLIGTTANFTQTLATITTGTSLDATITYTPSTNITSANSYNFISRYKLNLASGTYNSTFGNENATAIFAFTVINGNNGSISTQPIRGVTAGFAVDSAAIKIADYRGFQVSSFDSSIAGNTITNAYGLYILQLKGSANFTVTNGWGIYQVGTNDNNYFAGKVLIGTNTPSTFILDVTGTSRITGVATFGSTLSNGTFTYTLPSATGTLALTSDLSAYVTLAGTQTITGDKTFSGQNYFSGGTYFTYITTFTKGMSFAWGNNSYTAGYLTLASSKSGSTSSLIINDGDTQKAITLSFLNTVNTDRTYTFPNATGTLALTSDLGAYLPLTGGTLTGPLSGTSATFSVTNGTAITATAQEYTNIDINVTSGGAAQRNFRITNAYNNYGVLEILAGTTQNGTPSFSILKLAAAGAATFSSLAGTGSRAVLADASGTLSAPVSDISVKNNIKTIGYGLSEILQMNPVWFDFIDDYKNYGEGRQNGMIAQEMADIIPEAVFVTPSTGKMGINYDQLHGVYIKAIQELKLEIEELKALINK